MAETMQVSAQRAWTHLKKYQPLIHELVSRDLKVKYRRSFLGYIWSILNPLLMMLLQRRFPALSPCCSALVRFCWS